MDNEQNTDENNVKSPQKKRVLFRALALFFAIVLVCGGIFLYRDYLENRDEVKAKKQLQREVAEYEDKAYGDKLFEDIDLSGMTAQQIAAVLSDRAEQIKARTVSVGIDDDVYTYTMNDLNEHIYFRWSGEEIYETDEVSELAERIVALDKELSIQEQKKIIDKEKAPTPVKIEAVCETDENKIKKIISEYQEKYDVAPKNATINTKLKVKKEKEGTVIDTSAIASDIGAYLSSASVESFNKTYYTSPIKPKVYAKYLKPIRKLIGSYTTSFIPDNARGHNVKIAAGRINGVLLNPDEEISFLERLYDASDGLKYEESGGFLGDKVVQVEGGGICQVSTTAYDAFLTAGIVPVERHPHTCPVSYAPMGLDAALAIGTKDLVVRNTLEAPILICTRVKGAYLTVEIYSYKNAKNGYTYKPRAVKTEGELAAKSYLDVYVKKTFIESIALSDDSYKQAKA